MKKMKSLLVLGLLLSTLVSFGQHKEKVKLDKIIKRDYTIIDAIVKKVSEKNVEYSLPNETLLNSIETAQVARIEFANGRAQTFSAPVVQSSPVPEPVSLKEKPVNQVKQIKKNTIAVLPVPFVNTESLATSEELAKFAQNDIYSNLVGRLSNIFPLTIQDLRVTNSLLKNAGIDYKNIDETPIEELQNILGVDNIVAAKVSYTTTKSQTTQNFGDVKKENNKVSVSDFSNTNTDTQFQYNVYFDMYKEGSKIFTQTRKPFLNMKDSWKDAMTYLLKRSPIYVK